MINPTPVDPPRHSPYRTPTSNRQALPRTLTKPVTSSGTSRFSIKNIKKGITYTFIVAVIAAGTYIFAELRSLAKNVIVDHQGDNSSILSYTKDTKLDLGQFTKAGDGRFNLLVLGIGGEGHEGANLTDTIKVLSVDTLNKQVTVTSIPRDLYVNIQGYGWSKINVAYQAGGALLAKQTVGQVLGIKVSHFVLMDFSGMQELVDTLGGIDITVPTAIDDPYFPDDATHGYAPFKVKAGFQHMDGNTALRYSRSRETTSDFDRAFRQTLVMKAVKDKALTAGVLANPTKVTGIVNSLGNHVKTDLPLNDIMTLVTMMKDVASDHITSEVLSTDPALDLLADKTNSTAGYISYPLLGKGNYADIQQWYQKNAPDPFLVRESPSVTVIGNGSASTRQLQAVVGTLKDYGYQATLGGSSADRSKYSTTTVFDTSHTKPVSHNYLGAYFGVSTQNDGAPAGGSDFTVVYVPGNTH